MKNKRMLMRGTYSVGISAIVVAVVIVINLFVGMLPEKYTSIHTNPQEMPVISEETKEILKANDKEITIYHLFSENATSLDENGEEISIPADDNLLNILEQYEEASDKITVKTIDPLAYPDFVEKYTSSTYGQSSVIVETELRSKFISSVDLYRLTFSEIFPGEFFTYEEAYNIYYQYTNYGYSIAPDEEYYFYGENELTRAIDYVTRETLPVVYELYDHAETTLKGSAYGNFFVEENAALESLSFKEETEIAIPEDADLVLINNPLTDITEGEKDALIAYLEKGGQVILTTFCNYYVPEKMPNLAALCSYMGLSGESTLVAESKDASSSEDGLGYYQYIDQIIPVAGSEGILKDIPAESLSLYMTSAHSIKAEERENITAYPLFKTTENAYLYTDEIQADIEAALESSEDDEEIEKLTDEIIAKVTKGEYALAYQSVLTDGEGAEKGKLYWFATPYFLDDSLYGSGTTTIFSEIFKETCDAEASVSLIGVQVEEDPVIEIPETEKTVWIVAAMVALPIVALLPGIILWISRLKK